MTTIGHLKSITPDGMGEFIGHILSIDFDLDIHLTPNESSNHPQAPSHNIFARSASGKEFPVGAAWTKSIKTADRYGEQFLSLTLDDPSFPRALNVAAFKNANGETWDISWRRRQDKQGQKDPS